MRVTVTLKGGLEAMVRALAAERGITEQEAVRCLLGSAGELQGWAVPEHFESLEPQRSRRDVPGFVYLFAHSKEPNLYKIGFSVNPLRRLEEVAKVEGSPISLVCSIPSSDMRRLEWDLHRRYGPFRVRGEWFNLSDGQAAEIAALAEKES